ncbi:hypothetical protein VEE62_33540 [Escherichia coli]|nr:hypothetical protein VEE62_33540 [Escherichia coli]
MSGCCIAISVPHDSDKMPLRAQYSATYFVKKHVNDFLLCAQYRKGIFGYNQNMPECAPGAQRCFNYRNVN